MTPLPARATNCSASKLWTVSASREGSTEMRGVTAGWGSLQKFFSCARSVFSVRPRAAALLNCQSTSSCVPASPSTIQQSGVRPSPGAAVGDGRKAPADSETFACSDIAAPEDGRTPLPRLCRSKTTGVSSESRTASSRAAAALSESQRAPTNCSASGSGRTLNVASTMTPKLPRLPTNSLHKS